MRVLFVTTNVPGRVTNGGEQWTRGIADSLRRLSAEVTLIGFERPGNPPAAGEIAVATRMIETGAAPLQALGWGMHALLARQPYTVAKWTGRAYRDALTRLIADQAWDLAVVDHVQMAWTLPLLGRLPAVHLSHHHEAALYARQASTASPIRRAVFGREARLIGRLERRLVAAAAETWCINTHDRDALAQAVPGARVSALPPLCRPDWPDPIAPPPDGPDLALIGNWRWGPNRAALESFLRDVVPLLPDDWRIDIAGAADMRALPSAGNVRFRGPVTDACAFLRRARRIAVPSLAEVGCNLKLLDAIAAARPLVASRCAVASVGAVPGHVRAVDDPRAFAAALRTAPEPDPALCRSWSHARRDRLDTAVAESVARITGRQLTA